MWPFSRKAVTPRPRGFRYERFGGIVQLTWPRALVFVDRVRARRLGYDASPLWVDEVPDEAVLLDEPLSAPLEAHLQLTNRCDAGCQGCYTGATPEGGRHEWGLAEWKAAVDVLAARGVFHLALGGGESALLPWLGELVAHARSKGVVPNLTTSGLYDDAILERVAALAPAFGQINVSVDGVGEEAYRAVRGPHIEGGFARADRALRRLRREVRHVGINAVVTRASFPSLATLFAYARKMRLNELELLRFKPSGRGVRVYEELRCTDEQHRALLPTILGLARKTRLRVHLDCSYTPMVAHHRPPPKLVRWLAIYGCAGGDLLMAGKANGALSACSFAAPIEVKVNELDGYWDKPDAFGVFRRWRSADEPCRSCDYFALCRGGCRVVTSHVSGDASLPDPECPRVMDAGGARPRVRLPLL